MNVLEIARKAQIKRDAVSSAQFLRTKVYRGVDFTEARLPATAFKGNPERTYRGISYIQK